MHACLPDDVLDKPIIIIKFKQEFGYFKVFDFSLNNNNNNKKKQYKEINHIYFLSNIRISTT